MTNSEDKSERSQAKNVNKPGTMKHGKVGAAADADDYDF
jgi:hypothetical protein